MLHKKENKKPNEYNPNKEKRHYNLILNSEASNNNNDNKILTIKKIH